MEAGFILRRFATLFSRVSGNKKVQHKKTLKVDCGRFDRRLPTRKIAGLCCDSFFRALHEGLPSGKEFAGRTYCSQRKQAPSVIGSIHVDGVVLVAKFGS